MAEKSGTFLVRVPKTLHTELARQAADEGISLNQYVNTILAAAAREHEIARDARAELLRIGAQDHVRKLAVDALEPARRSLKQTADLQRDTLETAQLPAKEVARMMRAQQEALRSAVAASLPADLVRQAIADGTADALEAARAAARPPDPRDYLGKRKPAGTST
jgi:hypothetical protein